MGFFVGIVIGLVPLPGDIDIDQPNSSSKQILSGGLNIWKVIYFSILMIVFPFAAIEPLKKRLHLEFFPFPFIIGNATSMGWITLISIVSTLFDHSVN